MANGDSVRYFGTPLTRVWNRVLFLTWALFAVAMGFLAAASQRTGKRLWWVDAHGMHLFFTIALIYCSAIVVMALAIKQSRFALLVAVLLGIGHIVSYIYSLMNASDANVTPVGNLLHLVITLGIAGGIFVYYWRDEHRHGGN